MPERMVRSPPSAACRRVSTVTSSAKIGIALAGGRARARSLGRLGGRGGLWRVGPRRRRSGVHGGIERMRPAVVVGHVDLEEQFRLQTVLLASLLLGVTV